MVTNSTSPRARKDKGIIMPARLLSIRPQSRGAPRVSPYLALRDPLATAGVPQPNSPVRHPQPYSSHSRTIISPVNNPSGTTPGATLPPAPKALAAFNYQGSSITFVASKPFPAPLEPMEGSNTLRAAANVAAAAPPQVIPADKDDKAKHLLSALRWHMVTEEADESRQAQADVLLEWVVETLGVDVKVEELDRMINEGSHVRPRRGRPSHPQFKVVNDLQRAAREKRAREHFQRQKDEIVGCGKTRSETAHRQAASSSTIHDDDERALDDDNGDGGASTESNHPAKKKARFSY